MNAESETSLNFLSQDDEWLLLNAIRQAFGIAHKSSISYSQAAKLAIELAPNLIDNNSSLLATFDSSLIKLYKARAEAQSQSKRRSVKPSSLLNADIKRLKNDLKGASLEQKQVINLEVEKLERARVGLEETNWTETQAINHDADVPETKLYIVGKGQGYKEYRVSKNRRLRVKVLHPDPPEWVSGVDLIYENYYDKKVNGRITSQVRVAALQYKMWDGSNLYTSQAPNLLPQLEKMKNTFCESGFCNIPRKQNIYSAYRLPYCAAFLRPTDKKQAKDSWQVTHAWQVPVCTALEKFEITEDGNKVLRSSMISNSSTTQDIFQEMFNRGMLGSGWQTVAKLKKLYNQIGVFDTLDRVTIHAQEY